MAVRVKNLMVLRGHRSGLIMFMAKKLKQLQS